MKKIAFSLLAAILLSLCGCAGLHEQNTTGADFYYLRADIVYGAENGVIACEKYQGQIADLSELLDAYFRGSTSGNFRFPFPPGTTVISAQLNGSILTLRLSSHVSTLSAMDQTLAYACLAKTCFAYGTVSEIRVQSEGSDHLTILTPDNLILRDSSDTIHATIGTEPISP